MNVDDIWTELIKTRKGDRAGYLYSSVINKPIPQSDLNEMIDFVWTNQEFPHQWRDEWAEIWQAYQRSRVKDKLIKKLFKTPRIIYRGGHRQGLSWTFSKEKAIWFSKMRSFNGPSELHQRLTYDYEVKMIYNDRREQEVVLDNQFWLYDEEI